MMLENLSREELIAQLQALHQQHNILQVEVQALRHQNDYYHQLFEHTGDAILLLDASDFRIVDINDNAARRWGYNREQLLAMNLEDVEVYDDTQGNVDFTLSSFSDTHIYEAQIKRADGSLIHVEVSSRPLVLDGRDYLQNHIRDITRRKQAEQANQQLINDLEAFTHTVAHDLKNPLQTVIGYGAMLQDMNWQTTDAEELETLTRYLHNVVAGSQKMSSIINELLQLAKIRAEDVQLTPVDSAQLSPVLSRP
jgi:PAS domain S-box-containing protein